MGGASLTESVATMKGQIVGCTKASVVFWTPAVTYALTLPDQLQIPFLNLFGFVWTIYLAVTGPKEDKEKGADSGMCEPETRKTR